MTILITGAAGFIGSHLVEKCVESGCEVKAFVRYNSSSSWGWLDASALKSHFEVVQGDIRDYDSVQKAMRGCEGVFHLAALIGIPYSYDSPLAYIRTNIEGTYNILEASRRLDTQNVIITSTSETYGTAQYVPIDEKHPLVGQSPYSATKIAADQMALSYFRSFDSPVKIARPFNTYGPRQSARAVIPTIIGQILQGGGELNLGNVTPTRDLVYVEDTVSGFLEIFRSEGTFGEVINIGTNNEISIAELAEMIGRLMDTEVRITDDLQRLRPSKSEVERLRCDNTKILELTSWAPSVTLEEGITKTIAWLIENRHHYKANIYHV